MGRRKASLIFCLVVAVAAGVGPALASSEVDTVISECQSRTGMGRDSCITFIRKYMNIERCQEYTQFSAEECQKKLEAIRTSPEFQVTSSSPASNTTTALPPASPSSQLPVTLDAKPVGGKPLSFQGRVLQVRAEKEKRFLLIEEKLSRLIRFFESQGQATEKLQGELTIFQERRQAVLKAYDQYAQLAGAAPENRPPMEVPRRIVVQLLQDTIEYYRAIVLPVFQKQLEALPDHE